MQMNEIQRYYVGREFWGNDAIIEFHNLGEEWAEWFGLFEKLVKQITQ